MQTQQRPRFRQDLVAEPVDDNGARFVDLLDPDSGHVFRFYEVEYSLACAMDGERDVAGIVQWAKEELGLTPSPNEVKTVITTLGDLGYLEGTAAAHTAAQPTGRPAQESGTLAPGIVVGQRAPVQPSSEMELGHVAARSARDEHLPEAPDLELGAPGTAPSHRGQVTAMGEEIALGQSGRGAAASAEARPQVSDVSLDLSEEMSIGRDDVKEAVRQSQVMRAVDVPPELLAATEAAERASEAQKAAAESRVEARSEPRVEPKKPPAEQPRTEARAKPAVDLPKPPHPAQPRAATVPPRSVSPVFILLLVVAVVVAGAFFAWKYLLNKENKQQESVVPPQPVEPVKPVEPAKPPPPPETAKLTSEQPDPQELKPTAAGVVETILAKDAVVKSGDVVARLAGNKPLETEVLSIRRDIEKRVQPELAQAEKDRDAAQAAGNKAGVTTAETRISDRKKSLEDKQGKLAAKQAELDKYLIKSPVDGKVTTPTKANTRVTPSDPIAKIVRAPTLVTTLHAPTELAPNTKVILKIVGDTEQKLTCTATTTTADGVRIVCPGDVAKPGAEVTLVGADASQPATTNGSGSEIEMGDEGSGSAATGSAATGSAAAGSAAAGSAAAGSAAAGSATGSAAAPPKAAPAHQRPAPVRPTPRPPQPKPPEGSDKAVDTTTTPAPPPAVAPAGSDATK